MNHRGVAYSIHRGPRGWGWKIYSDADADCPPIKLGVAETRNEALLIAKANIEELFVGRQHLHDRRTSAA
jgi:hypothetical protein